jgi:hypothetical protein
VALNYDVTSNVTSNFSNVLRDLKPQNGTNQRPSLRGGNEGLSYGVGWIRSPESGDLEVEMKCDVVDVDGFGSVSALLLW